MESFEVPLPPLTSGRILNRYKRFLADIELENGEVVVAHCPNTGAMTGCWQPGAPVQLSASNNPKRKLDWTLERVDMGQGWIGVNTARVNGVIEQFIVNKQIDFFKEYEHVKREPRYEVADHPRSRFDLLLQQDGLTDCYIEIKNCTLLKNNSLQFPDAVSTRGQKHLALLGHAAQSGFRSVILFAVNRPEGEVFTTASEIDAEYDRAFRLALKNDVIALAVRIKHTDNAMKYGGLVSVSLSGSS